MKPIKSILFLVLIIAGLYQPVKAQYLILKKADALYELLDFANAVDLYEQAYQQKPTLHAAERLASGNALMQNYKQAESWYAIAVAMPGSAPANMLNYAKALQNNAKYNEARAAYIKYAAMDNQVTAAQKNTWLVSCDSAMIWMRLPRTIIIKNLQELNSPQSDWGATAYQNEIVFSSDRGNGQLNKAGKPFLRFDVGKTPNKKIYGWTGNNYLHLYEQTIAGDPPHLFQIPVTTGYHVGPASFTSDGKELYFTLTRMPKKQVYQHGNLSTLNVEIYSSKKDSTGHWSAPVAFKYNNVNVYSVGDPYISADGHKLYFSSDMPGGKGGTDIYYCEKTSSGEWGTPENLIQLNTKGNDRTPIFGNDGNFYFSSDGRIGMGGLDIFKAAFSGGHFSDPVNMGYPVNSPQDDFAYNLNESNSGYFSSNRYGGVGNDDIYRFDAIEQNKMLVFKVKGTVYNKLTNAPIANALVTLSKSRGGNLKVETDNKGKYQFGLDPESSYDITAEKNNFRNDAAELTTTGLKTSSIQQRDLYLETIDINKAVRLENIYYDFDKWNIRPDAAVELDKLVVIMTDNPTIWIELGSHTDSRGNDTYNMGLSQKRANAAVQYIISRGINQNRITAKGYGETQLLNKCVNGIKCTEEEHQLNRRTEFKIVKQ